MPTIEISLVSHLVSEVVIKLSTSKQSSKQTVISHSVRVGALGYLLYVHVKFGLTWPPINVEMSVLRYQGIQF